MTQIKGLLIIPLSMGKPCLQTDGHEIYAQLVLHAPETATTARYLYILSVHLSNCLPFCKKGAPAVKIQATPVAVLHDIFTPPVLDVALSRVFHNGGVRGSGWGINIGFRNFLAQLNSPSKSDRSEYTKWRQQTVEPLRIHDQCPPTERRHDVPSSIWKSGALCTATNGVYYCARWARWVICSVMLCGDENQRLWLAEKKASVGCCAAVLNGQKISRGGGGGGRVEIRRLEEGGESCVAAATNRYLYQDLSDGYSEMALVARGAACSNLDTQPCAKTFGGLGGGGSAGQPPGSREGGQWVPQHTYLNMIPMTR